MLQGPDVPSRIVDAAVKAAQGESGAPALASSLSKDGSVKEEGGGHCVHRHRRLPQGPFSRGRCQLRHSPPTMLTGILLATSSDLQMQTLPLFPTHLQRLIIPTIMPAGLDAHQIINERERFIDASHSPAHPRTRSHAFYRG